MTAVSLELGEQIRRWCMQRSSANGAVRPRVSAWNPMTIPTARRILRIHHLAMELGVSSRAIIERCLREGVQPPPKTPMYRLPPELAESVRQWFAEECAEVRESAQPVPLKRDRARAGEPERTVGDRDQPIVELTETCRSPREWFDDIEVILVTFVHRTLEAAARVEQKHWWYDYVPESIRIECAKRQEEEKGVIQQKHAYWSFIHLKSITERNWRIFGPIFERLGRTGGKSKALAWMDRLNEIRRVFGHALKAHVSGRSLTAEDVGFIEEHHALARELLRAAEE